MCVEDKLVATIKNLKRSPVGEMVATRISEFKEKSGTTSDKIFEELCFCILTANFSAERSMRIQEELGKGFLVLDEKALEAKLRKLGHRYPRTRAKYIVEARKHRDTLKRFVDSGGEELREWLVRNVKGLGYKEASHFLRNIGHKNLAIIDFHILNILEKEGIIERPGVLTKKRYLEVENILRKIAEKTGVSLAELDLYLWYIETGKILK
ncbi:MAG: N-glycosylase [Methanobacteriota archaeon]|nr:MAG: N-glycosylase [Euryarchaeota archaeon]